MTREDHKAHARARGYFWAPCPVCGEEFGGHEVKHYDDLDRHTVSLWHDLYWGTVVCPKPSCQFWGKTSAKYFHCDEL